MKAGLLNKLIELVSNNPNAFSAVNGATEGGMPSDLPIGPQGEPMGPPEGLPPVDTGGIPEFNEETGLPYVAMEQTPDEFPGDDDDHAHTEVFDLL